MTKICDIPYKARASSIPARGLQTWDRHTDYEDGVFSDPAGIASIYIQGGVHVSPHTHITFAHAGVLYSRSWDQRFTRPTAVRLARQLIRQVTKTEEST